MHRSLERHDEGLPHRNGLRAVLKMHRHQDARGRQGNVRKGAAEGARRRCYVPSIVPAARPAAFAKSPPETFLPSSPRARSTSMRPPCAVTKKLLSPMSVTSP